MKRFVVIILAALIAVSAGYIAFAQDQNTADTGEAPDQAVQPAGAPEAPVPEAADEGTEYGYGTVVSVNDAAKEIVISEYNWETDSEGNVTYAVAPDAVYENVGNLAEIAKGSYVDVEYLMGKDGKRLAKLISVYEPEEEEIAPAAEGTAPAKGAAPAEPTAPAEPAAAK